MSAVKIVGVGLNKTGTKTLGTCLQHWGFRHVTYSKEAFDLWRMSQFEALMNWVRSFDSFEDWPWPLLYKEIDAAFPGSKFVLTTRQTPEIWFKSLCDHAKRTGPTAFRKFIYGYEMPDGHEAEHIAYYERHNQAVRDHFASRPGSLLEICWEDGGGWKELGDFFDLPVPDIPFPHANKSPFRS